MRQVTDRDIEMVNILIREPDLSLEELGARLAITKQVVAERRSRLESPARAAMCLSNFFAKSYYPRQVCCSTEKRHE